MKRVIPIVCCMILGSLSAPSGWAQSARLEGVVTDIADGLPLPGANVILEGTTLGAATDAAGFYKISDIVPGTYTLTVRFVGYQDGTRSVTLAAGETGRVNVALKADLLQVGAVIVSASRRPEKILDAPASISILDLEEIERDVSPSTVSMLRNTPGIDISSTGVDRSEVVLRGFNNAFSGAAYVLTDNREAAVPSLGVNVQSLMPALNIDLERVEIVRGPGSALYGPGVDAGVIHYLSKDPFVSRGTTFSILGGERNMASGALRHAGVIGKNWGYKITGTYTRADDWELDPDDPIDAQQLDQDVVEREYDYERYNVNGLVKYRFEDATELTVNAGLSRYTGIILSGIGTLQADGFGYAYGQVRIQSGGFFGQAYFNQNSGGDSFVYGTGTEVIDDSNQLNIQAQQSFDLGEGKYQFIVGADYELTTPDTDETIYGRNEADAAVTELGGYAQATIAASPQVDLTLALRGDYNDIVDDFQVSPRVAAVFKAMPGHTFRASYNRAFSSPTSTSLFLDIQSRVLDLGAAVPFKVAFQARGAVHGFTFDNYRDTRMAPFTLPAPGFFGQMVPVDAIPLLPVYGVAVAQISALLNSSAPLPAPLTGLTPAQRAALASLLASFTPAIQGTTKGTLGVPLESGYRKVNAPVDIDPLRQTTSQMVEIGYKGVLMDRVLVAVDGFYANQKDFVGPLNVESPLVYMENLAQDLATSLTPVITAAAQNPQVAGLLAGLGLTPQQAAALVAGLASGGLEDAGAFAAIIQPDQQVLAAIDPNYVGGFLSYRNFGNINYYGVDASVQVLATDQLNLFGNVSWINDDLFDNEELDEADTSLELALNAPTMKLKGGFSYQMPKSFSVQASARYVKGFPVRSGAYIGTIEDYTLLDLGFGYDFDTFAPGLRADVLVQNVLDDSHREFIGAPELGRMALAKLTYTLP